MGLLEMFQLLHSWQSMETNSCGAVHMTTVSIIIANNEVSSARSGVKFLFCIVETYFVFVRLIF